MSKQIKNYDADTAPVGTDIILTQPGAGGIYNKVTLANLFGATIIDTNVDDLDVGGTLDVTGAASLSSTLEVTGAVTMSSTVAAENIITGGKAVVVITENTLLTANEMRGYFIDVTAACTVTLPDVTTVITGGWCDIHTSGAIAVHVDPNASDRLILDGVELDDGDKASNTSTNGDTLRVMKESDDGWYAWSIGTTWTDGG